MKCLSPVKFMGECQQQGLNSMLISKCPKCNKILKLHTSQQLPIGEKCHYSTNIGAVLGQIATGGGSAHLDEQLACIDVPSISQPHFLKLEKALGYMFDNIVTQGLLSAGNKERQIAISNNSYCEGIPACTVVVDGGWSKRCHKHSYNAKSGVAVIFGAESKSLLYIGVRNKYCCTCAIAEYKGVTIPPHTCYKNWSGSSCAMEADIIVEGFKQSETLHGLRYVQMIGDGDSSVHHAVCTGVPSYGRLVQKLECANHAMKCYRSSLEKLAKENSQFKGRNGLTSNKMQQLAKGMRCAIRNHSVTSDVASLRRDLRNCPRHCFGDHSQCSSTFCKKANQGDDSKCINSTTSITNFFTESLEAMPPGLFKSVDIVGDRLVSKAAQLVQNKITNISENFMSVRCKVDGGKYFNRVQSGSFQHGCMAAALRVQHGPSWLADVWNLAFSSVGDVLVKFSNNRKRQHTTDTARKIAEKYKKRRLLSKSSPCPHDNSYGQTPTQPDVNPDELQHLC